MIINRKLTAVAVAIAATAVIVIYGSIDPASTAWMPRCVWKVFTGYDCPGCGSQRALHALLHGDIAAAWHHNAFIFFLTPVGLFYFILELRSDRTSRLYRISTSPRMILMLLISVIAWWIGRNIPL